MGHAFVNPLQVVLFWNLIVWLFKLIAFSEAHIFKGNKVKISRKVYYYSVVGK